MLCPAMIPLPPYCVATPIEAIASTSQHLHTVDSDELPQVRSPYSLRPGQRRTALTLPKTNQLLPAAVTISTEL